MKNPDDYQLHMHDLEGNHIEEEAAQFILSLAPSVKVQWEDIENIFADDRVGRSYYFTRQLQLDASMETSIKSGQYKLYRDIFFPAKKLFIPEPPLDEFTMDQINNEIDDHLRTLGRIIKSSFHPCNPTDMLKLQSAKDSPEYPEAMELSLLVRDLADKRPYIGDSIRSIPRPIFQPNTQQMQSQVLEHGYFTDDVGMRFYVPDPSLAKEAMVRAISSKLPALKLILDQNLKAISITNSFIYYAEI